MYEGDRGLIPRDASKANGQLKIPMMIMMVAIIIMKVILMMMMTKNYQKTNKYKVLGRGLPPPFGR